jgi:hypothetical protein
VWLANPSAKDKWKAPSAILAQGARCVSVSAEILRSLVYAGRTYTVIPIQIGIVGHLPAVQVRNTSVCSCLWTAKVGILIDRDRGPAEDLDGSNLIIQLNLGNICAPLPAEIISCEIDILEEASSAARPAVLMTALTGIPPRRSSLFASGVDLEPSATPSIHPDSIGVIAPGLAANTPCPAKLLEQDDLGVRIWNGTGLKPVMVRLASEGLSVAVLRSCLRWSEKTQEKREN